jgi:ligand-binding sensor domain-containing protein
MILSGNLKSYVALLLIIFCSGLSAGAQQDYVFQHLTAEDGLMPGPRISVYQDKEGFYWFASISGLQRYDGKSFVNYDYKYSGRHPVLGDWVVRPLEDNQGNIWTANQEGISIFNRRARSLDRLYLPDAPDSSVSNVAGIIKDRQGQIWIITSRNISRFDNTTQKPVSPINVTKNRHWGMFAPLYDSARNGIWVILLDTIKRIIFVDLNSRKISHPIDRSADLLLGHNNPISAFYLDNSANLWLANYLGDLCEYNTAFQKLKPLQLPRRRTTEKVGSPNSAVQCILDDGNDRVWLGGDYYLGVNGYDKEKGAFVLQRQDNGSEYGLHYTEDIYNLYTDREGNIWVGSDLGFNIFNPARQQFNYLRPAPVNTVNPFSADITSIYQSHSGDIWIGTWGAGIFRYDSNFNLVKTYIHDNDNPFSLGEPLNKVWCFCEDGKGNIWVGCQYAMLSILNLKQDKFRNTRVPEFQGRTIMHCSKDSNGNIWFGLHGDLTGKWIADSAKMVLYTIAGKNGLTQLSAIKGLFVDNRNKVWWSNGFDGLQTVSPGHPSIVDTAFLPKHFSALCSANDSTLVGDSAGKSLFVFNPRTKSTQYYPVANASPVRSIYGVLPDGPSSFWIIANEGIGHLSLRTGIISAASIADGITDRELEGPYCRLRNGTILFAAKSGVIYFNPQNIKTKTPPPDVRITGLQAGEQTISVDSLPPNSPVELPSDRNRLTIDYASLSFEGRKSDRYCYQLEGLDKEWTEAGAGRSVTYANLSSGRYFFRVKSKNADGIETSHITTVPIYIYPPWWRTWWAITLYIGCAVLVSYAFIYYRKQNLAHLSKVRQKIASDLHDDIGSTLNSISVYSEVAIVQFEANPVNSKQLLQKMGGASRQMIETMNDIVWAINPLNDQFENVIQRMQYFAGELLSGKDILLQFDIAAGARSIRLAMDQRKNIYLIFKEAVNNAYKYSQAKTVTVSIATSANNLLMTISDDGTGFILTEPSATEPSLQGNGLHNMKFRSKEIHAHLQICSWPQKGTSIELKLPLK